jgi:hypothetical protein
MISPEDVENFRAVLRSALAAIAATAPGLGIVFAAPSLAAPVAAPNVNSQDGAQWGNVVNGPAPASVLQPLSLADRVRELGLTSVVKFGDDPKHRKHLAKLVKKLVLDPGEEIVFTISAGTMAGAYGTAFTDRAIRSRDLMEEPITEFYTALRTRTPQIEPTLPGLIFTSGGVHALPKSVDEAQRVPLVRFVEEFLALHTRGL